jgi:hypothetical protein
MGVKCDYFKIHIAWNNDISSSDIYHMIVKWIDTWRHEIIDKNAIHHIETRMSSNDSIHDIVEDFIYGKKYVTLRSQFEL